MTTTKGQIHKARDVVAAAVTTSLDEGSNEELRNALRVLLAATAEHEAEIMKANAARLAAEHDRDEARAAEEHMRQERDEARKRAREWEDLHEKEMAGRLQEGRYVALQARVEHAEAELLKQMRERKAAEQWRDQERQRAERAEQERDEARAAGVQVNRWLSAAQARIAELEARLARPTQEQRNDEADMLAWQVGG